MDEAHTNASTVATNGSLPAGDRAVSSKAVGMRARSSAGSTRQSRKRNHKEMNAPPKRAKRSSNDSDVVFVSEERPHVPVEEAPASTENIFHQSV